MRQPLPVVMLDTPTRGGFNDWKCGEVGCICEQEEENTDMNPESVKLYVEDRLERMEAIPSFDRSAGWFDDQLALRRLWIEADQVEKQEKQNELLLRIAIGIECLENLK